MPRRRQPRAGRRTGAVRRSSTHTFRFPAQQHKLAAGDMPVDPAAKAQAGTIDEIDDAAGTLGSASRTVTGNRAASSRSR
jgi:hypothetical protein